MKVGLTGVTGHVGANLFPLLIENGLEVRCFLKSQDPNFPDAVIGDITDEVAVDEFVNGMDVVIHLAAKISISGDRDGSVWNINAAGTRHVVHACLRHEVKRLVHMSSINVFDPAPADQTLDEKRSYEANGSAYGKSKIEAELAVQMSAAEGLETIILCPTSIVGPNDFRPSLLGSAIIDMYQGSIPALTPGGNDFVDVRDVATATFNAITKGTPGSRYLISGRWASIKELSKIVGNVSGVKTVQRVLPFWFLRPVAPVTEFFSRMTGNPPRFTRDALKALSTSHKQISSKQAHSELDFHPRALEETIKDTLDFFRKEEKI